MRVFKTRKLCTVLAVILSFGLIMPPLVLAAGVSGENDGDSVVETVYDEPSTTDEVYGDTAPEVEITTGDSGSIEPGDIVSVEASVYGENILRVLLECELNGVESAPFDITDSYDAGSGMVNVDHQLFLPGTHEMTITAENAAAESGHASMQITVVQPQVAFAAPENRAVDADKVYYYRVSGSDELSFNLDGLAPGVEYRLEFGFLNEDGTLSVSGAVYDGSLNGEETGAGSGVYNFSTPIMNENNNNMHPLAVQLHVNDDFHSSVWTSSPFEVSDGESSSYVNVDLPGGLSAGGYRSNLPDQTDLTGIMNFSVTREGYGKIEFKFDSPYNIQAKIDLLSQLTTEDIGIDNGLIRLNTDNELLAELAQKDTTVTMYNLTSSHTPEVYNAAGEMLDNVVANIDFQNGVLSFDAAHPEEVAVQDHSFALYQASVPPDDDDDNDNGGGGSVPDTGGENAAGQSPGSNPADGELDISDDTETVEEIDDEGKPVVTTKVKESILEKIKATEGPETVVIEVPANEGGSRVEIPAAVIAELGARKIDINVRTQVGDYTVPAALLQQKAEAIAAQLGVDAGEVQVRITAEKAGEARVEQMNKAVSEQAAGRMLVAPVEFRVEIIAGETTTEVSSFGNNYVQRGILLPGSVELDGAHGVVLRDGALNHVPTRFVTENGRTRAVLFSQTNSVYTVMENRADFKDISGHWAENDIRKMAAKLIVRGTGSNQFLPAGDVTRAQFAAFLVRALGLDGTADEAEFSDISPEAWYAGVAGTAAQAGLISGYPDGTFRPGDGISRQEMAVLVTRALNVAGYEGTEKDITADYLSDQFKDSAGIDPWAGNSVAIAVQSGIISGMPGGVLNPGEKVTRAQAVAVISRMMDKLDWQ